LKIFERLVLHCLYFYLESKNLSLLPRLAFDLVRPQLTKFFSCPTRTASKRKGLQSELFCSVLATIDFFKAFDSAWHSAFFHKLLARSVSPCFVCLLDQVLSVRQESKGLLQWCSKPLVLNQMRWALGLCLLPGPFHRIGEQRFSSMVLKAARSESDAVSLRALSLAYPFHLICWRPC